MDKPKEPKPLSVERHYKPDEARLRKAMATLYDMAIKAAEKQDKQQSEKPVV